MKLKVTPKGKSSCCRGRCGSRASPSPTVERRAGGPLPNTNGRPRPVRQLRRDAGKALIYWDNIRVSDNKE
jgi:hypothetical protein